MFHAFIQLINSYTYKNNTDFLTLFFDSIIDDDVVNPFKNIEDDTRTRIFNGSSVSKDKAADLSSHINREKLQYFYEQNINPDDLNKLISKYNAVFNSKVTVSINSLTTNSYELLNNLLYDISNKRRKSPEDNSVSITSDIHEFNRTFKKSKIGDLICNKPNEIFLYTLNSNNGFFDTSSLTNYLENNIGNYVFSKLHNTSLDENQSKKLIYSAMSEFINYCRTSNKSKEAIGEYLIYSFLECILKAPKIKSKIEMSNSINGQHSLSEGIHIKEITGSNSSLDYQLIFGSSNLSASLEESLFQLIDKIKMLKYNRSSDLQLFDSACHSLKLNKNSGLLLRDIIIPNKSSIKMNKIHDGFGIFLGYSFNNPKTPLSENQYLDYIKRQLEKDIQYVSHTFNEFIQTNNLFQYSFYIYLLPFENIDDDISNILSKLSFGGIN